MTMITRWNLHAASISPTNFTENRVRRRDDKRKTKKTGRGEKEKRVCKRSGWRGFLTVLKSRNSSLRSTEDVNVAIFNIGNSAERDKTILTQSAEADKPVNSAKIDEIRRYQTTGKRQTNLVLSTDIQK
ncbi:uncharacterized protein LOC126857102 [Cataglyphis hispanica]|uniref:uncharacterized protein LOC126857102 n=1 Tax=Cataglyphis hispanica TaxID=1086592 RepID=UPI00217F7AFC|nr:uncharacterized protein LOC126857102 [Cataglyphis hispanica]